MPLDTLAKRASALNIACPWRAVLPTPTGAVSSGDRAHVAHHYSGLVEPGGAVALQPSGVWGPTG